MAKINILPPDVVNKIAAGEVVERPASVVKELLDNAYDSKASHITVEVEEGGINKIQVTDNGAGMNREDAELAFHSHATSKITTEEDLMHIKSFGFRGEALSSIAAVSKVTLRTRENNASLGTEVRIEGGQVISVTETGAQIGTTVIVEDLFYNVPARKEFLKSSQSEYRAILDIIDKHAVANPEIGLIFINNGKTVYSLPKNHQVEDRVREVMGPDIYEKLIPIFYEHPHIEVYGFIAKPEAASERQKNQFIFVNKRAITDKSIAFAVKDAFGSLIAKNTSPAFAVFIDVASNIVDVNVHPRKEEVKFSNSQLIFEAVRTAVKKALERTNLTPGAANANMAGMPAMGMPAGMPPRMPGMGSPFDPFGAPAASPFARTKPPFSSPFGAGAKPVTPGAPKPFDFGAKPFGTPKPFMDPFADAFYDKNKEDEEEESTEQQSNKKVLSIHQLYLVAESESGIHIYDQHAVHERIMYEKLINEHKNNKDEKNTQGLLAPIVINLSAKEASIVSQYKDKIEETGFLLEEFGPNTYKVTQVPAVATKLDIKSLVHELIDDLENDEEFSKIDNQTDKILTYLSCRMAYKSGDTIPEKEAAALIEKLETTEIKYTCPHGRPVKIEITLKELAKMFKRT